MNPPPVHSLAHGTTTPPSTTADASIHRDSYGPAVGSARRFTVADHAAWRESLVLPADEPQRIEAAQ